MNKKTLLALLLLSILIIPTSTMAQIGGARPTIDTDLTKLGNKIADAIWIIFTIIAVIMFVVAGITFLMAQGDPEKVKSARNSVIWGVAGIVVAILAFTIINVVKNIF